ncbi:MAG: AAA family ATPase [Motilibacteraceae bacterium]
MLTRLEADGFKNLLDFAVDFGPYTCIAGPNAVGKSNIFDAIEFLSLLADHPFMEAALRLRSIGSRGTDPRTLFWGSADGETLPMRLAAEMIVPDEVEDDFGRSVKPTTSFLRYEVELQYEPPEAAGYAQMGRIALRREELRHIKLGEAAEHLPWPHSKRNFRDAVVFGRRAGTAYISTTDEEGAGVVNVHQDGGSRGQPRTSPAARAPRTVVSTTTTSDDPTILAARREMQQWRALALEPSAMRSPDAAAESSQIAPNGAHLAAALYRLRSAGTEDVYAAVAAAAAALTDVRGVDVDFDPHRELLTLQAHLGSGPALPARALSDGTLRFLALCIISVDTSFGGLLCMEEPENGIHPGRIEAMVDLVRSLAVDPQEPPGPDNPFRQVIVNTHSPYFVRYQSEDDLLLAMPTSVRRNLDVVTTVKLVPLQQSWRGRRGAVTISRNAIMDYLRLPPGAQFQLDFEGRTVDE